MLDTPANLTVEAIVKSRQVQQENARTNHQNLQATRLGGLPQAQGHTLQQIAEELNE